MPTDKTVRYYSDCKTVFYTYYFQVDSTGKCRVLKLRGRNSFETDVNDRDQVLIDLISWLEQFKKPEDDQCQGDSGTVTLDVDEFVDTTLKNASTEEGLNKDS